MSARRWTTTLPENRLTRWLNRRAYTLGLSSGGMYSADEVGIVWTGKRCYFLGWPRGKWACLLRFHHWPYWPDGRPVAFGMCGKCIPWPCCGSIDWEHKPGCEEAAP